jgi:hypothetical protein
MDNLDSLGLNRFYGGWATDKQMGSTAQFYYSRALDFRKNPSNMSVLPAPINSSGSAVTDLILDMDQIGTGVKYAVGDSGNVYRVTTANVWSKIINIGENSGAGLLYRPDVDMIYITGQTKVARYPRVSTGSLGFQPNWFSQGISTCSTCYKTGGTATDAVPTTIDEISAVNRRSFTADIEPLSQIGINIATKGTGNWTLTLHDDANTVLGTVTVANANLTSNKINYFVFSTPIRIQRGDNGGGSALTYHYHITSTVADGTLVTTTAGSLADSDMELWASALVPTTNTLHPIIQFSNLTLIGNGRYVAGYEPLQDNPTTADYSRHLLTLPPGFEVCGFAQKNLMCIIGAEKRSSTGQFQEGMLFFWDGISDTYNDFYPVPEGSPESLFSHKNVAYFIAGGALYRIKGTDVPVKIWTFRNTDSEYSGVTDITRVFPNMMTVRRGILLAGYPSMTSNITLEHGVYSYGSITSQYPDSFGYNYVTSNGNNLNSGSNNLRIGMVKSYSDTLFISWRDDSSQTSQKYGVDIVNNSSTPAPVASFMALQFNDSRPTHQKMASYMMITFDPLPVGVTVTPKYIIDSDSQWTYGTPVSSTSQFTNYAILNIGRKYKNVQFGFDIAITGTLSPNIDGVYLFTDLLRKEAPAW